MTTADRIHIVASPEQRDENGTVELAVPSDGYWQMVGQGRHRWGDTALEVQLECGETIERHSGVRPIFEEDRVRLVLDHTTRRRIRWAAR